jgi:tetratricopeptide (TPR) repeat protein
MTRFESAFPASILLLTLSVPTLGQSFTETPAPVRTAPMQSPSQTPLDRSVIVVKPELTDEQMGDLYMVRKEYREAAELYKRLAEQNPRSAVYLNKLGIALHQQAALTQALKYYERASKLDPTYADAQNNIGTIWYQRKKYGKAIRAYQRAIKIREDMAVLYSNLAYAYFEDRKYDQAMAAFRQTLVIDPQFFEHNGSRTGSVLQDRSVNDRGRFYYMLAKSYAEAGNVERCLIYLRKAKDEGYKELTAAKSDPAFAAVLKSPAIQEVFAPKPPEDVRP